MTERSVARMTSRLNYLSNQQHRAELQVCGRGSYEWICIRVSVLGQTLRMEERQFHRLQRQREQAHVRDKLTQTHQRSVQLTADRHQQAHRERQVNGSLCDCYAPPLHACRRRG